MLVKIVHWCDIIYAVRYNKKKKNVSHGITSPYFVSIQMGDGFVLKEWLIGT